MKQWTTTDFVTVADWNRIRHGIGNLAGASVFGDLLTEAAVSDVPTQNDVDRLRTAFSVAITQLGAAAGFPSQSAMIVLPDMLEGFPVNETYPDLSRFFDLVGDPLHNHFPAATELNLYESLLQYGKNRFGSPFAVFGAGTITGGGPFG